jgi:dTDP-L-rhamnose 4-epimerase
MPEAFRDFIYVDDVAEALFKAALLEKNVRFRVFNIGSGQAVRVREMVRVAERIFGYPTRIESADSHPGELTAAIADVTRAREELGWIPRYDVEAGIAAIKDSLKH